MIRMHIIGFRQVLTCYPGAFHKALEDERLKKKSVMSEKEALQRQIAELEVRYAEKAR